MICNCLTTIDLISHQNQHRHRTHDTKMSSGVRNGPARLVNPLASNLVSRLSLSPDITKRTMPVTCVGSLTPPGQHRRPKADQWKPINPPDPNDKDYDRSNVKMRVDDKRVLRPNLSDDSDEEDDLSDYDGSGESDLTDDREGDLSEGGTDSLVESPRIDEERGSESDDEEDGSETESHSDDEKSESSSGSDTDEDGSSRRRSQFLRRDCASDDEVSDIWEISDDVLKITSAVLNIPDDILKISDSGEAHAEDDSTIQEKRKSEKEDLLIFGRIREPNRVTTTPTKGNQQFPRGTKKFNPCHIDRNIHRNISHPQSRAGPRSYSASHRSGKNNQTKKGQSNRLPSGKVDGYRRQEKLSETPRQTTDTKTNLACEQKPTCSPVSLSRPTPTPTLPIKQRHLCANQNNNKPVTYADVCRRNPPKTSPPKPFVNAASPPTTSTGNHMQEPTLHTVSSHSPKKSHSDSELEPKIIETPQKLSSSSTTVELSKDEDPSDVPVVAEDNESDKNPVPPKIRDQDPAIVSVSTSPPHCPSLLQHPPSECPSPGPLPSYPVHGVPLFPPQYMTYTNPYAYSNYLFSVLNQLSPQDMLMIFYELKMLEAMNATLIQSPLPNTY